MRAERRRAVASLGLVASGPTIQAEEAALRAAFSFDETTSHVALVGSKTTPATIDGLPFAALVNAQRAEIEGQTLRYSDLGDSVTRFVGVERAGKVMGYILLSQGGDDSDEWAAAGYALFSAGGQLLDRQISTAGRPDTMNDDAVGSAAKRAPSRWLRRVVPVRASTVVTWRRCLVARSLYLTRRFNDDAGVEQSRALFVATGPRP